MENSNTFLEILDSLDKNKPLQNKNTILIVDGLNCLMRAFAVIPTVNSKGYHVGGMVGFLKSLGSFRRQFNPSRIVVVWDGKGGATNRKNTNPNYKAQRAHASVIHWDIYDNKSDELQSVHDQSERVLDYLDCLPVTYLKADKLEADDIIAYVARLADFQNKDVTIVSSDKDFLQLVSEHIRVYNPVKHEIYDHDKAFNFLGVLPENYNIVKALIGDESDNIRGIKGAGIKTLIKLFPELQSDSDYTLQKLYDDCAARLGTKKMYATIINDWDRLESNYNIMNLQETLLNNSEKSYVIHEIKRKVPELQVGRFMTLLEQDCIGELTKDTECWLQEFSNLSQKTL